VKREGSNIRRRTFTALSVLSLLLCLATPALWVRSYRIGDAVGWPGETLAATSEGRLYFSFIAERFANENPWRSVTVWQWSDRTGRRPVPRFEFAGFAYTTIGTPAVSTSFAVPMWFLVLLFAIAPAVWIRRLLRSRRRRRAGHCPVCGYDLRATPERCPECGTERVLATDGAPIRTDPT
jgi:hypothetical protein